MKYLGINLIKYAKDLHEENYKTLMKEISKELNKWTDSPCVCIRRLNTIKIYVFPTFLCRYSVIPIKILGHCFVDIKKLILKFIQRNKRMANTLLKENKVEGLTLSNFKTY